jgi:hypothetical protein
MDAYSHPAGTRLSRTWIAIKAIAAALIALVKAQQERNAILHNATDLNGAIKINVNQEVTAGIRALAERKPQFVQVGGMAYNLDHVQMVNMRGETVLVWFNNHPETDGPTELEDEDAAAFLAWWNANANVIRLDAEPEPAGPDWGQCEEVQ